MKILIIPFLAILYACNGYPQQQADTHIKVADSVLIAAPVLKDTMPVATFESNLRPHTKISLNQAFKDTVTFIELNEDGDHYLCHISKGGQRFSLIYNERMDQQLNFLRGDTIEIQWRLDSTWVIGDGDKLEFREWLINTRKIKDGRIVSFRKKYPRQLKYWYGKDTDYTDSFKDYLYHLVEYYLANSKQALVAAHLQDPAQVELGYSIEERERDGRSYTAIGLVNDKDEHFSIIQWLFLDAETHNLYEYDLANDRLILFP